MDGGASTTNTSPVISAYTTTRLPLRSPAPALEGLSKALVAVEWGNERHGGNFETKLATFRNLAEASSAASSNEPKTSSTTSAASADQNRPGKMVHSLRSLGSAALNCCAVARGDVDAYWEGGCWAWDVGAGWVIVQEAGGVIVGGNPGEWKPEVDGRSYLVVRGAEGKKGQKEFVEELWDAIGGGKLVY